MVRSYMLSLGYLDDEINSIVNSYSIYGYTDKTLYNKIESIFNYFINLGYNDDDIRKMSLKFLSFYSTFPG